MAPAVPISLKAFEHQQFRLTDKFPGVDVASGRLEIEVLSDTGAVSGYASVLDDKTQDPLLVFPVQPKLVRSTNYIVPGVAEVNTQFSNFHTDMRIFNGGTEAVTARLRYSVANMTPPNPVDVTIAAGEVRAIDDVLPTLWNLRETGGAVILSTASDTSLVVTARTRLRCSTVIFQ